MKTIEKVAKAIDKSNYKGFIVVNDSGRFDHIKLARSSNHPSRQIVWLSKPPSKMTISEIVDEINSAVKIKDPQKFIDSH